MIRLPPVGTGVQRPLRAAALGVKGAVKPYEDVFTYCAHSRFFGIGGILQEASQELRLYCIKAKVILYR